MTQKVFFLTESFLNFETWMDSSLYYYSWVFTLQFEAP